MSRFSSLLAALVLISVFPADDYRVNVKRESANLYRVLGEDVFVITRYCYEYVYFEDSLLRMSGRTGEIIFLDSGGKCSVKGVYGRAQVEPGVYRLTVMHQDQDRYEIAETGGFVKTSLCLNLAVMDNAAVKLSAEGLGRIYFSDGDECMVEGVYDPLSL